MTKFSLICDSGPGFSRNAGLYSHQAGHLIQSCHSGESHSCPNDIFERIRDWIIGFHKLRLWRIFSLTLKNRMLSFLSNQDAVTVWKHYQTSFRSQTLPFYCSFFFLFFFFCILAATSLITNSSPSLTALRQPIPPAPRYKWIYSLLPLTNRVAE